MSINTGTITSGSVTSLSSNDNVDLSIKSSKSGNYYIIDWNITTKIDGSPSIVKKLTIMYDGSYSKSESQTLYLYNFVTNQWQSISSRTVSTSDVTITYTTNTPANFISSSGQIQL